MVGSLQHGAKRQHDSATTKSLQYLIKLERWYRSQGFRVTRRMSLQENLELDMAYFMQAKYLVAGIARCRRTLPPLSNSSSSWCTCTEVASLSPGIPRTGGWVTSSGAARRLNLSPVCLIGCSELYNRSKLATQPGYSALEPGCMYIPELLGPCLARWKKALGASSGEPFTCSFSALLHKSNTCHPALAAGGYAVAPVGLGRICVGIALVH
eukprot:scaffold2879_cov269-Prasinococcus_capsulatus_cf.AAC.1